MIQIKNTKPHSTSYHHDDKRYGVKDQVLVTEAKLVLVKVDNSVCGLTGIIKGMKQYDPILISETEDIRKGEKVYQTVSGKIIDAPFDVVQPYIQDHRYRKILAQPEHFSPQQLQMIVDGKLKDGDKLLVECVEIQRFLDVPIMVVKTNPHITIYPVEEEVYYKRDDVKEILKAYCRFLINNHVPSNNELTIGRCVEWFKQNVK